MAGADFVAPSDMTDEEQGTDVVMVKPAMSCLDIIRDIRNSVSVPVSAYHVSGEYAMGWINEEKVILESLASIKRAGADLI